MSRRQGHAHVSGQKLTFLQALAVFGVADAGNKDPSLLQLLQGQRLGEAPPPAVPWLQEHLISGHFRFCNTMKIFQSLIIMPYPMQVWGDAHKTNRTPQCLLENCNKNKAVQHKLVFAPFGSHFLLLSKNNKPKLKIQQTASTNKFRFLNVNT